MLGMPFETARTLLARATSLVGKDSAVVASRSELGAASFTEARDLRIHRDLGEAMTIFERLGASGWAEQTAQYEKSVASSHARHSGAVRAAEPTSEQLSSREMRVAIEVAAGRTNKQVSSELYISVKTVEFHLQSIYRKLKVRNRAEFVGSFTRLAHVAVEVGAKN